MKKLLSKSKPIYKGPIIEIRGMVRLILSGAPFFAGYFIFPYTKDLWMVAFLCATFTSASFVGIESIKKKFGYSLWITLFVGLSVFSAWQFSEHAVILGILVILWSVAASLSFAAGPVVSLPVNIGCTLFILFLLNNRLVGESLGGLMLFAGCGLAWSYLLGLISVFAPHKNHIDTPSLSELHDEFQKSLNRDSPYLRNGVIRGIIIVLLGIAIQLTNNQALIITVFTVLIAMIPGKNQTRLKILSRVGGAIGALFSATILVNMQPPLWIYFFGLVIVLAFTRWIILRKYTYNSFFLVTYPLFLVGLGGFYDNTWDKLWYTVFGAIISIIASELFVFKSYKKISKEKSLAT